MRLDNAVIDLGETQSSKVSTEVYDSFTLYAPAVFTGAVSVEASPDDGISWNSVLIAGTPIILGAGEAVTLIKFHGTHFRVVSDMAEVAERIIQVHGSGSDKS